jgi:chromosome partitioning protein
MIVVVGGIKGGSGKTTIATNLTVIKAREGKKTLLIDADEQRSASDWSNMREGTGIHTSWTTIQLSGKALYAQIKNMSDDYEEVIVDVGGRDTTSQRSSLLIADVFLIPFKPRSLDIWTIGNVRSMINEIKELNPKLRCMAVINQADCVGSDNSDAFEIIKECTEMDCLPITIGYRKAFGNAAAIGQGVIELDKQDPKSIKEIMELAKCVYYPDYCHTKCAS